MLHLCDSLFGGQSIPWYIYRSWWLLSQAGLAGHCVCNFDGSLVQLLQGFCSLCKFTPVMFAATELHKLKPKTEVRSHLGKESQQLGIPACTRQCAAGASGRAKPAPALVKASR